MEYFESAVPANFLSYASTFFWGNLTGGLYEFPHLGKVNLRIPPRFPALETWGKPHKSFPRVSTPGNNQTEDSTCLTELWGNLTGGFHEFPHLRTVNLRIPHGFSTLEILWKPRRVSTSFHTWD